MATVDTVKGRYSSYKLLSDVGHGGSARVFHAQDVATKRDVAVKQLFGNRPQDREDWLREVDALNTLNNHHCPHIVQYLDHMQQHDKLFLVEEYAEHGSLLRQLKQEGPLSESTVSRYIFQVLVTLQRMLQWGFIHGDLKASNLLLFENGVVKLTDFALRSRNDDKAVDESDRTANNVEESSSSSPERQLTGRTVSSLEAASSDTRAPPISTPSARARTLPGTTITAAAAGGRGDDGARVRGSSSAASPPPTSASTSPLYEFRGSVYWAAPEVLAGESRMTAASDIWSVGCTAFELLTGAPPYFDRSLPNATHHVLKHYYELLERTTTAAAVASSADSPAQNSTMEPVAKSTVSESTDVGKERSSSGHEDGEEKTDTAASHAQASPFLLPPLPESLSLSAECVSFLQLCLHLRASDRPSAQALLHHPWFYSVVVPQLLHAAREGRAGGTNPLGEEIDEAGTHPHHNSNTTSNNANTSGSSIPTVSVASSGGGGMGDRFAVIERWVELNLRRDQPTRCKTWLLSDDALPLLVPVLTPRIMTPTYIGRILRCFAHFIEQNDAQTDVSKDEEAQQLVSLFVDRLGVTELWTVEGLTSACDADHLAALFRCCCADQDAEVRVFTPTHPFALRFVLGLETAKVQECVAALHRLLVEDAQQQQPQEEARRKHQSNESSLRTDTPHHQPRTTNTPPSLPAPTHEETDRTHDENGGNIDSGSHGTTNEQDRTNAATEEKERQEDSPPNDDDGVNGRNSSTGGTHTRSTSRLRDAESDDARRQQRQQRQLSARRRLLHDGGAAVLCHFVETQCKTAFLNATQPVLAWRTLNLLLDCVAVVEGLPGGQTFLWGYPSGDSEEGDGVSSRPPQHNGGGSSARQNNNNNTNSSSPNNPLSPRGEPAHTTNNNTSMTTNAFPGAAEGRASTPHNTPAAAALNNENNNNNTSVLRSPPSINAASHGDSPPSSSALTKARGAAESTSATTTAAAATTTAASAANPGNHLSTPPATHIVNNNNNNNSSSNSSSTPVMWTTSLPWVLAVQQAAHHGCPAGLRLLTSYIPIAPDCPADYLSKAGQSVAATMVLIASNEGGAAIASRRLAIEVLPRLQGSSLRAARYLRDAVRCVPLLATTLKRASTRQPGLTIALLRALRALTTERQTLAACATSAWMWDALTTLLDDVQREHRQARSGPHRGVSDAAAPTLHSEKTIDHTLADNNNNNNNSNAREGNSALLTETVSLISYWFADVSPNALLSMTTAAVAAQRNAALSPPPPLFSSAGSAYCTPTYLSAPAGAALPVGSPVAASGGVLSCASALRQPSFTAQLQVLRRQLGELSTNAQLCDDAVLPHVEKTLEYLASLDTGAVNNNNNNNSITNTTTTNTAAAAISGTKEK